jgi:hypothetical protein
MKEALQSPKPSALKRIKKFTPDDASSWESLNPSKRSQYIVKLLSVEHQRFLAGRMRQNATTQAKHIESFSSHKGITCPDFESIAPRLSSKAMKFLVNWCTNTNMTAVRRSMLYRKPIPNQEQKKKCPLCENNDQTVSHILCGCHWSLGKMDSEFNRMLWRHNRILATLLMELNTSIDKKYTIYTDLPDNPNHYSTPPIELIQHGEFRPDLILTMNLPNSQKKRVIVLELTSPMSRNVDDRHQEKMEKYLNMAARWPPSIDSKIIAFEVAADTGQVSESLNEFLDILAIPKRKRKKLKTALSIVALDCSSWLYHARDQKAWAPTK